MNIFRKKEKPVDTAPGSLEERVRLLESRVRQLDDDLSDLFERHTRLQGRRAKREAVEGGSPEPVDRAEHLNNLIRMRRAGMHNGS